MPTTFRGGEIYGIRIPTVFDDTDAIRCAGCGEPIRSRPFRVSIMDIVATEYPAGWASRATINPGPHQFHLDPDHVRAWMRSKGYLFCRLSDIRELMRPIPIPDAEGRWGLCDGLHQDAHEFVPA